MDTGIRGDRPLARGEAPARAGPSLQATRQKQEDARIAAENAKLLSRITKASTGSGEFSPAALAKAHDEHVARVQRISRFPPPS